MKLIFILTLIPFLTFCTSVEEETFCHKTNWRAQGKNDAFVGKALSQFKDYAENCQYYDAPLDKQAYYEGFGEGLTTFCTVDRAKSFGEGGGKYQDQCPAHLEIEFIPAYNKAYTSYLKEQKKKIKDDDD